MNANAKECKKLIEVAMPIKEISAESVRDKSIRHGHISTLHLWWARRPLPVCRAVVFASLIPDPLDENCPQEFKDAVESLLFQGEDDLLDLYKPYESVPPAVAVSSMEDNLRNRLLMFMGKFSELYIQNEAKGKKTPAKDQLSEGSLIKWDNKNNEKILNKARKLIWVAHDPANNSLPAFDEYYQAIKEAEKVLYETPDRHLQNEDIKSKEERLQKAIDAFLNRMPKVFDPFAGGGAIPLEAARLGCRSYGNDINPVAHIIQKGSLEFPQKYGKPITYSKEEFINRYGQETLEQHEKESPNGWHTSGNEIFVENRLAFDVEYYAKKLIQMTEEEVGHLYPTDEHGNKPIAYYWARVATCSNPSCRAEVPLLRQFHLVNKKDKKIFLNPVITGKTISFEIGKGNNGPPGWVKDKKLICPICENITDKNILKENFVRKQTKERLIAVISETSSSKDYRLPTKLELSILDEVPSSVDINERITPNDSRNLWLTFWGVEMWGQMFSKRQLHTLNTFVSKMQQVKQILNPEDCEYSKSVSAYLGILIDRIAVANTSFGVWHTSGEKLERIMGRQAIPMVFDYPESNPFCHSSGSAFNQLEWLTRYIKSESDFPFPSLCINSSSGESTQFDSKTIDCVVTDPPYYDAIAYADLSDFFYTWLKRTISDIYPMNFAFPQTPKAEECTALKHHHNSNAENANNHFETKLQLIFESIEKQTSGIVSIMFAHQSTQAWTTLCNSILGSRMNITASWANETEMTGALKKNKAYLASSITVSCKPFDKAGFGDFKQIKRDIDNEVKKEVKYLYKFGFRGADLLTACFGQAVSEFGKYERVEKADGTEVTVAELLETARDAAFNAIISDIRTDDITRFYIGWLNLFSFIEAEHDDVRRITQIGLNVDVNDLLANDILLREGNRESLAGFLERNNLNKKLGQNKTSVTIDKVHRAMFLFDSANRGELLSYIKAHAAERENPFWRVLNSLVEILPAVTDDFKMASGLLANKESLISDAKKAIDEKGDQLNF